MVNQVRIDNLIRERRIIIIAGSNGAGKTTFAREFLPKEAGCPLFVNADLIAAGLSPFEPVSAATRAGRLLIEEMESHIRRKESFSFETPLSDFLRESPEEKVREADGYKRARERQLKMLKHGFDLGTGGRLAIPREELPERR